MFRPTAIAFAAVLFALSSVAEAQPPLILLEDDFNDNSIDPAKWNVVTAGIPQVPKSAVEQNMQMELEGRAHLNSAMQFDPTDPGIGGFTIRGQWEFVSGDDFMQILTRTDGVPAGGFGETANGIEFQAVATGSDNVTITARGAGSVSGVAGNGSMPGGISGGDIFDFVIMDDGTNLSFELTRVSNPADTILVTATSNYAPASNLISFHNRESGRRSNLDNLVIESQSLTVPEPASVAIWSLIGLGLAGFGYHRVRRKK